MPTILTKNGFRIFFYSGDWNEPIHVHVEYGEAEAKFWLKPLRVASVYKMKPKDLKRARLIIEEHADLIEGEWNEYFSKKT